MRSAASATSAGVAVLLLLCGTPALHAQVCLGRPIGGLAPRAIVAEAASASYRAEDVRGTDVGLGYWHNPGGRLAFSAHYNRRILPETDLHVGHAEASVELPLARHLPPAGSVCLTAGLSGSHHDPPQADDERLSLAVPLGFGVGFVVPVGMRARLFPYLNPRLILTESSRGRFPRPAEPFARLGLEAGVGFANGPLILRARLFGTTHQVGGSRPPFPDLRGGIDAGFRF